MRGEGWRVRGDLVSRGLEMSVGSLGLEEGTGSHTWWGRGS